MTRSGKVFAPVFCLFLFYMFIKELKKSPFSHENNKKTNETVKNITIGSIVFLSLLIDEMIIFTLFFMTILSFIVRFLFKKKIDRILLLFSFCCGLYLIYYFFIGRLILFGSLNVQMNYHEESFLYNLMNPIAVFNIIFYAYEVWSAVLSNLFVSSYFIITLFIMMQYLLIKKRKYMESFICISVFIFSFFLVFISVSSHIYIFANAHNRNSYYLLPATYLSLGIIIYSFSTLGLSLKKNSRVLMFACVFIILYNVPKMLDYYSAIISGGVIYPVHSGEYTQKEEEFVQLLNDHGINKYIVTRLID